MPTTPTHHHHHHHHHHLRSSPMAVAIDHHHHNFKRNVCNRRCRLRSFPHPDPNLLELPPSSTPFRSFHRSLSTPCFSTTTDDHVARIEIVGGSRAHPVHSLVVEAAITMASSGPHSPPLPASKGLSGAYILRNRAGECFAVLKPVDQEQQLPLSVLSRPGSRLSVHAGETGVREVAAYLLDHGGFSGVPPTALVKISHPAFTAGISRIASIQRFVPHDFDAGDLGPSRFSVTSVHRIGILDVRLLNIDRHAGNILVKKQASNNGSSASYCNESMAELVPIDHGLCLPDLLDDPYFEWLHWPQAAVPFTETEMEYISALDPYKDADLVRAELPSLGESAIRILILCTVLLKRAAIAGLCLAEIGGTMTREFCGLEEGPSMLEALCKRAADSRSGNKLLRDPNDERDNETGDEPKEFQFDMDCDDGGFCVEDVVDVPLLLKRKLVRSRSGEKVLLPLNEEEEEEEEEDEMKVGGGITKSQSFSAADFNYEGGAGGGGGSKCISFKGMSEEEWGLFLERFEQLLPEAFEARKSMGLKQRLGTSCKF